MAKKSDIPTFDSFGSGTIAVTSTPAAGPDVRGAIFRLQTAAASDTPTVTIRTASGSGGTRFTGSSPIVTILQSNLNQIEFVSDANVTVNYSVEK